MNKRLWKILLLVLLVLPVMVFAEDKKGTVNIVNEKQLIAEDEIEDVKASMEPLTEKGSVVLETKFVPEGYQEENANNYLESKYKDGSNLVVMFTYPEVEEDIYGYESRGRANIYIYTSGDFEFSKDLLDSIIWLQTPTLRETRPYSVAITIFNQLTESLNGEESIIEDHYYESIVNGHQLYIYDSAKLLSDNEIKNLVDDMTPLTKFGHIAFVSIDANNTSTSNFAEDLYHNTWNTESGTLFLIDMDNREIYIFSDGENYKSVTNSKAYSITDNVYKLATDEKYYECAKKAFQQIYMVLDGQKIAEPMRYTSNVFIALTISFLCTFLFVMLKSMSVEASDDTILANCDVEFAFDNVRAVKTGQHKEYSPVESSGGGSSGGGGGGGGGSSGGGGGHGF